MPFELGLAVGIAVADKKARYDWRTLEEKRPEADIWIEERK